MAEFTGRLRPLLLCALLCGGSATAATPLGVVQGTTGTVSFYGGLLSAPCSLAPDSQDQSISARSTRATSRTPAIGARRCASVCPSAIACWARAGG
ncbi:Uncharacterised protein [Serratia ficaria]|uniref:hypothetical protein n=1 Tax=Serratia ficaria TaxID=61651 RepID=UPI0021839AA9|nr:hypothetical protein [Serratia ficaria]CAI2518455.1 Uncharacterised protein [Serratia ficaria]